MSDGLSAVQKGYVAIGHLSALRKVYERLHDSGLNWAVCAGMSLVLQGVPLPVHDIDLRTTAVGAYEIESLFAEYVTRRVTFSSKDRVRSHFGALCLDGITVEIIGDIETRTEDGHWQTSPDPREHTVFVTVEDMQIPVLSLEYECAAYRRMGRHAKANVVQEWLDRKRI